MPENRKKPLLFEKFPDLEANIPWEKLAPLRTPVKKLKNLEEKLGVTSLWVKKDDLSSPLYGGNKVRKLEFILASAKEQGKEKVLTGGGLGSSHCLANAIFCNQLNLNHVSVLVYQPITSYVQNNLLLDSYFKNEIIYTEVNRDIPKDSAIYYMPPGGSSPLGTLGIVNSIFELKNQIDNGELPVPDYIFVACGTSGTTAGLLLGSKILGLKSKIHSVQTSFRTYSSPLAIRRLTKKTWKIMAKYDNNIPELNFDNLSFNTDYFGGEYGLPTKDCINAMKLVKETEGIKLDPTYTGKAFAALLGFIQSKKKELKDKTILFWNTYNSRDFSDILPKLDYHKLPEAIHWVFEEPQPDYGL